MNRIGLAAEAMKRIVLVLAMFSAGCGLIFNGRFDPSRTVEAERIISVDPEYKKMDDLCRSIPLPANSEFVGKARMFNSIGIMNFYAGNDDFDTIEAHFTTVLLNNGWEFEPNDLISRVIQFRKNDLRISSTLGGIAPDITFSLTCEVIKGRNGAHSNRLEE